MPRDSLIYLQQIIITKNFNMENIPNYRCAVIASELHAIASSTSAYLETRLTNLYTTAILHHHDVIVLGAWGCGAFAETEDDTHIIATHIKGLADLYKDKIKTICAVLGRKQYKIFKAVCV